MLNSKNRQVNYANFLHFPAEVFPKWAKHHFTGSYPVKL